MKLIECNSQFEEELTKIVFGDDLEFIHSQHVFEQSCLFEDYNPVDTKFVGKYSEIIKGTAHGEWKCESEYFVCSVSKEDIQKLQKKKFLLDLNDDVIYVFFEIGLDDSSMYLTRSILLIGQFNSKEKQAEKLLLHEFANESLKQEPPGKWRDFLKGLLD